MQGVTVGNCGIGREVKVIVPLTGHGLEDLSAQAEALAELPADLAEWRVDLYGDPSAPWSGEDVLKPLAMLRKALRVPLLATFRTKAEGGREIAPAEYRRLCAVLCGSGNIDALDVEAFSMGVDVAQSVTQLAHQRGVTVVASSHDFSCTPPQREIVRRLRVMHERVGADIAKIAVMPQSPEDVLTLLAATLDRRRHAEKPIIAMSMGKLGAASRFHGHFFGSAAAFASAGSASAPGQPDVRLLAQVLDASGRLVAGAAEQEEGS